jgi:hypothetical protein
MGVINMLHLFVSLLFFTFCSPFLSSSYAGQLIGGSFNGGIISSETTLPDGDVDTPALAYTTATGLGWYKHATKDKWILAEDGVPRFSVGSDQNGDARIELGDVNNPAWNINEGFILKDTNEIAWVDVPGGGLGSRDIILGRIGVGILGLFDDVQTNPAEFQVWGVTGDDAERFVIRSAAAGVYTLGTEADGSGIVQNMNFAGGMVGINQSAPKSRLHLGGTKSVLIVEEVSADPVLADLTEDGALSLYTKSDTLVFAYNNGGTLTFVKLPLDGSTTTLTHDTSAP